MAIIFETSRLIVRRYAPGEFENFFRLNGDEEVVRYIRAVQGREEAMETFKKVLQAYDELPGLGRWAVHGKDSGEFVGSFAIIPVPWDKEKIQLGYAFPREHWGKGFASELTRKGLEHFWNHFTLPEIYAVTETPNIASQHVLLKAGFSPAGSREEEGKELLLFTVKRNSLS